MIISFSGHRSPKIGGFKIPNPTYDYIRSELRNKLIELKPEEAISGMAIGFDTIAAEVCIELGIALIAATPFVGQQAIWPVAAQNHYLKLLAAAKRVEVVSPGGYAAWKMQVRNQWMSDHSDIVIACFDGSPGGTKNAVDYAKSINKQIIIIDPTKAPNETYT